MDSLAELDILSYMSDDLAVNASRHRKTCRRYDVAGHAHLLTFSCFRRRAFLSQEPFRRWMLEAIDLARQKHNFHLWAFVVMPEHVHVLILPLAADYSISAILTTMKQSVAKRSRLYVQRYRPDLARQMIDVRPSGKSILRFWARGGGYDRNLWSARYIWQCIDYVHGNPVRRGLCASVIDWPFSSARFYHGQVSSNHGRASVGVPPAALFRVWGPLAMPPGMLTIDGESLPARP